MPDLQETENVGEEEEYADELAIVQAINNLEGQIGKIEEESRSYGNPSLFKYGILMALAISADAVIIGSYFLFGTGMVLGFVYASPFVIPMILIAWLTDTKLKSAQNHPQKVKEAVVAIQTNIATATRVGLKTAKYLRGVPGMRGVSRAIPRALVKIRRVAGRSPVGRILTGTGCNAIPIINLVPWQVISVVLAYREEKRTYESARQTGLEVVEQLRLQEEEIAS